MWNRPQIKCYCLKMHWIFATSSRNKKVRLSWLERLQHQSRPRLYHQRIRINACLAKDNQYPYRHCIVSGHRLDISYTPVMYVLYLKIDSITWIFERDVVPKKLCYETADGCTIICNLEFIIHGCTSVCICTSDRAKCSGGNKLTNREMDYIIT